MCFGLKRLAEALGISPEEQQTRSSQWLERVGLASRAHFSPWTLSYGQQRLLALATVLSLEPRILCVDDPCAGLDAANRALITSILEEEMHARGMAILWTAHELPFVNSPKQHLHLEAGRLEPGNFLSA